jgi:hypothetical protein
MKDTGGSAFPWVVDLGDKVEGARGMTLRDYFAAKAIQAIVQQTTAFAPYAAKLAYQYADAMLKAREE